MSNAQGASAFGFIKKEMKKGQDVEFLIQWPGDGFHWVTVTGFFDAGKDMKTLIVHDPLKGDGNNYWKLKDDGTFTTPNGTANRAVAESVPEPSNLALLGGGLLCFLGFGLRRATGRGRRDFPKSWRQRRQSKQFPGLTGCSLEVVPVQGYRSTTQVVCNWTHSSAQPMPSPDVSVAR